MAEQDWVNQANNTNDATVGAALTASATLTDISPIPQFLTTNPLPRGKRIRVTAKGIFSTTTGTNNLTLGVYYGGIAGTLLAGMSAVAMTASLTNLLWQIEYEGIIRSIGTSGSIWGAGDIDYSTSATAATHVPIPSSAVQTAVTIDTTVQKAITIGAMWSAASNSITCEDFAVYLLN